MMLGKNSSIFIVNVNKNFISKFIIKKIANIILHLNSYYY